MNIDWTHFTPWAALAGGVVLGVASAAFMLLNGRILGISGILGGLLTPLKGDRGWRIAFLLGMACAPTVFTWIFPAEAVVAPRIDTGHWGLVLAGLAVGVGTSCASGCTSGHGVCGLSRLSPRSLVATASFMAAGFLVVFVLRHVLLGGSA
ncbi:MAG: YeeE/YedE family protein [Betaproteobacteria bacterium]